MKKHLLLLLLLCPLSLCAQEPTAAAADTAVALPPAATTPHIQFEGIELKGDIYEFSKVLTKRRFKLVRRLSDTQQYAMHGNVAGNACDFLISYTQNTRTVYRIMARPKRVNVNAYLDSLKVRYGEPAVFEDETYKWMLPNGVVYFKTPENYDPTLVIIDAAGFAALKDETDQGVLR